MPDVPVKKGELDVLQCGCGIDGALLEMAYVKLGLLGEDVAKGKMENGEKTGWRAMPRPERERTLGLLGMMKGNGLDEVIHMLIQK
jgi:hypothetical protein